MLYTSRWVSALFVRWLPTQGLRLASVHCSGSPDPSGLEDPLKSGEQVSVPGDDFSDGSYALYNLYNEKTAELDRELVNNWMEHVRDLMVLVRDTSLFGAPRCLLVNVMA
jgi:hypothetical protein